MPVRLRFSISPRRILAAAMVARRTSVAGVFTPAVVVEADVPPGVEAEPREAGRRDKL